MRNSTTSLLSLLSLLSLSALQPFSPSALCSDAPRPNTTGAVTYDKDHFYIDGKIFQIRSGEMHFARIPREYWRQRLDMARAMGLNTVCAYLFWNVHEPRPGEFNFTGNADVAAFVREAQAAGLRVILRPGPYACAEWDFGGLPAWLLAKPDLRVRCSDPYFTDAAKRYLLEVGKQLAPLQSTHGGPIILVQVENEYGSYGDDKPYLAALRDTLRAAGFEVPLFTCDGPGAFERGSIDGAFPVANFGGNPESSFAQLRKHSPDSPPMAGEFYSGWFDHWGNNHANPKQDKVLAALDTMLEKSGGFSIYMFHGGSNFGFTAGSNADLNGLIQPTVTSYDYASPLDEAGRPTEKYHLYRNVILKHPDPSGLPVPDIPPAPRTMRIPAIHFTETAPLFDNLPNLSPAPITDIQPRPMETYGQYQGMILYRTTLAAGGKAPLTIRDLHDYGQIYLDAKRLGTLDRRKGENRIEIPRRPASTQLDILVDTYGRINYGPYMIDRKGITDRVDFPAPYPAGIVMHWQIYPLPLDPAQLATLNFKTATPTAATAGPVFHRAHFTLAETHDTFLDMRGYTKGYVWVNGHNLGRYWRIGPQQTLYLPGVWLKKGENEIIVLELESKTRAPVPGLDEPILDEKNPEAEIKTTDFGAQNIGT